MRKQKLEKRKKKSMVSLPNSSNEYLAAGVDFEEAGEKWRGGDPEKSLRFFNRALDCYEEALKKFPDSFDLAYNKARIQYEVTQHPKLRQLLPTNSHLGRLQSALVSSKYALSLKPDNADALFNNAQILTSLAEELDTSPNSSFPYHPPQLLEEALVLFQLCHQVQENLGRVSREQIAALSDPTNSMDINSLPESNSWSVLTTNISSDGNHQKSSVLQDDCWAAVIEPVTNNTLLDTILTALETLTTLCQIASPQNLTTISRVQDFAQYFNSKLDLCLIDTDRFNEARVIQASFKCAYICIQFRSSQIDFATFSQSIDDIYKSIDISTDPRALCEYAESLIAYNNAIRLHSSRGDPEVLNARWNALTRALDYLTSASKSHQVENVAKIHLTRGDVELLRFQLGQSETPLVVARQNAIVLLKNAEKYFRGSATIARNAGIMELAREASIKESLVKASLAGDEIRVTHSTEDDILGEVIEEGLMTLDQLEKIGVKSVP